MKKFFVASLFFILILSLGTVNASNKINALNMDIYVDKSGDAHVTELSLGVLCNRKNGMVSHI